MPSKWSSVFKHPDGWMPGDPEPADLTIEEAIREVRNGLSVSQPSPSRQAERMAGLDLLVSRIEDLQGRLGAASLAHRQAMELAARLRACEELPGRWRTAAVAADQKSPKRGAGYWNAADELEAALSSDSQEEP